MTTPQLVAGLDGSPPSMRPATPRYRCRSRSWAAYGLTPRRVASYLPAVPTGADRAQPKHVCFDARGLITLIARPCGLEIVERT